MKSPLRMCESVTPHWLFLHVPKCSPTLTNVQFGMERTAKWSCEVAPQTGSLPPVGEAEAISTGFIWDCLTSNTSKHLKLKTLHLPVIPSEAPGRESEAAVCETLWYSDLLPTTADPLTAQPEQLTHTHASVFPLLVKTLTHKNTHRFSVTLSTNTKSNQTPSPGHSQMTGAHRKGKDVKHKSAFTAAHRGAAI